MRRSVRIAVLAAATLLTLLAGLAYPWAMRGAAWLDPSFQHPWLLLGLLVVPVVFWWGTYGQDRRKPRLRIGTIAPLLHGPIGFRAYLRDVPGVLRAVALTLLIVAMARPVSVLRDQSSDEKGIDIVVVMDLSGSMRAVLDSDPRDLPSMPDLPKGKRLTRLDTAKVVIRDFISRRKTDRIGIVVFAVISLVPALAPAVIETVRPGASARIKDAYERIMKEHGRWITAALLLGVGAFLAHEAFMHMPRMR